MDWLSHSYLFVSLVLFGEAGVHAAAIVCVGSLPEECTAGDCAFCFCLTLTVALHTGIRTSLQHVKFV